MEQTTKTERHFNHDSDLFWFPPAVPSDWETSGNFRTSADKMAEELFCSSTSSVWFCWDCPF